MTGDVSEAKAKYSGVAAFSPFVDVLGILRDARYVEHRGAAFPDESRIPTLVAIETSHGRRILRSIAPTSAHVRPSVRSFVRSRLRNISPKNRFIPIAGR